MIHSARYGVWETNSSSVHQLVIQLKDDQPARNLILRHVNFFDYYHRSSRDSALYNTPQEKLDLLVWCIQAESDGCTRHVSRILKLERMLSKLGVALNKDLESFIENEGLWAETSDDIISHLSEMVDKENTSELEKYLFDNSSYFATEDNGIYYDRSSKTIDENLSNNSDHISIIADY